MNERYFMVLDDHNFSNKTPEPAIEVDENNFLELTLADIEGAANIVKHDFESKAAQNLIRYFHFMLRDGYLFDRVKLSPVEQIFIEYVEHAFSRIVEDGKSIQVGFGLTPGRGEHQREDTFERDIIATSYMILLRRNGWSWIDAKEEAAGLLFLVNGSKAVEEAYSKYRVGFETLTDDVLIGLLPSGTPISKRT